MTAGLEVMEVLVSLPTDLSCLEERASLVELGSSRREPREARWDNMTGQVSSTHDTYRGGLEGREVVEVEPRADRGQGWSILQV